MSVIGVIMEVNPFHNGHKYFLSQVDKKEDDILIAIISTTLCQRGSISVLDKKVKTELLLENNVDIVISLPSLFSNQGGYYFAYHALRYLRLCKIDKLYFGSECNDLNLLKSIALNYDNSDFKDKLYNNLNDISSNDILGISYLRAINNLNMNIDVKLINRIDNNYNDENITGNISSATSIRNNIDDYNLIKDCLPKYSLDNVLTIDNDLLYKLFKNNLIICYSDKINIFLSEDMELINKMYKYINLNYEQFMNKVVDKNNSKYKINRLMLNVILNVTVDKYDDTINYIQVLGFNDSGQNYLKSNSDVNFVTTLKNENCYVKQIEDRASLLLSLVSTYEINLDYSSPIIRSKR